MGNRNRYSVDIMTVESEVAVMLLRSCYSFYIVEYAYFLLKLLIEVYGIIVRIT
jgi:hypothetical protein